MDGCMYRKGECGKCGHEPCTRCGRERKTHSRGLCKSCYSLLLRSEEIAPVVRDSWVDELVEEFEYGTLQTWPDMTRYFRRSKKAIWGRLNHRNRLEIATKLNLNTYGTNDRQEIRSLVLSH